MGMAKEFTGCGEFSSDRSNKPRPIGSFPFAVRVRIGE
jgi:hypothetical protein